MFRKDARHFTFSLANRHFLGAGGDKLLDDACAELEFEVRPPLSYGDFSELEHKMKGLGM